RGTRTAGPGEVPRSEPSDTSCSCGLAGAAAAVTLLCRSGPAYSGEPYCGDTGRPLSMHADTHVTCGAESDEAARGRSGECVLILLIASNARPRWPPNEF